MSELDDPKDLIFTRTWFIPVPKNELFNTFYNQLSELYKPINYESWRFYQPSWIYALSENHMDFFLSHPYMYIIHNIDYSKPRLPQYMKLKKDYEKNNKKIFNKSATLFNNGEPYKLHIDILKTDENSCEIELTCLPFLYYNINDFKAKIDDMEKRRALLSCERFLKTLAIGLNVTDIGKTESDLADLSAFLGIDRNWITCAAALQLQEVAVILVSKKKGIDLSKTSVEKILDSKIKESDFSLYNQFNAFTKEVKRRYNIDMPQLTTFRKIRQASFHSGYSPKEEEKDAIISFTIGLLRKLKAVYEAKENPNPNF